MVITTVIIVSSASYAETPATEKISKSSTEGIAAHIGIGSLYGGGAGASVEYQFLLRPNFRLTPFVSAGITFSSGSDTPMYGFGYCFGLNTEFFESHRLLTGLSFGTHEIDYETDSPGHENRLGTLIGPSMYVGYKGTARFGLLWILYGGVSGMVDNASGYLSDFPSSSTYGPVFGFGLGYKF